MAEAPLPMIGAVWKAAARRLPAASPAVGRWPRAAGRRPHRGFAAGLVVATVMLAGCGSASVAELPPPGRPAVSPALTVRPAGAVVPITGAASSKQLQAVAAHADDALFRGGSLVAHVDPRARTLAIRDPRTGKTLSNASAGVGPTRVACAPLGPCYVVDTQGDGLLVFRVGEGGKTLRLSRRVYVAGTPYGIAIDPARKQLWVTLTARNQLVGLPAHGRPHITSRQPTVRQPNAIGVDARSGTVVVRGDAADVLQLIPPARG